MSAKAEAEGWRNGEGSTGTVTVSPAFVELESFFRNANQNDLVMPLRKAREQHLKQPQPERHIEEKQQAALALQKRWETWLNERESLRDDIKRGTEYLDETRLAQKQALEGLERWSEYESLCGKNPLFHYTETMVINERIERFLPNWLNKREERLAKVMREMELCARENGLEHLL